MIYPLRNAALRHRTPKEMVALTERELMDLGQLWEDEARFLLNTPVDLSEVDKIQAMSLAVGNYAREAGKCYAAVAAKRIRPADLGDEAAKILTGEIQL